VVPRPIETAGVGGAMMVTVMVLLPVRPRASVAVNVTWLVPPGEGFPLITPVMPSSCSPPGRVPEAIDQVYGGVPPVAARVWEKATSTSPLRLPVVMSMGFAMLMLRLWRATAPLASVTRTTNEKFPVLAGVPLMMPVVPSRVSGGGNAPLAIDQVTGSNPPVEASVCEYGWVNAPPGSEVVVMIRPAPTVILRAFVAVPPMKS
jgi:hypothetical protein